MLGKKILIVLLLSLMALPVIAAQMVRVSDASHTIHGIVVNHSKIPIYSNEPNPFKTVPPPSTTINPSSYAYTLAPDDPVLSSKILIYYTKNKQNQDSGHGCYFWFTEDDSGYYIAAAGRDEDSHCSVKTASADGYTRTNFLVIQATS